MARKKTIFTWDLDGTLVRGLPSVHTLMKATLSRPAPITIAPDITPFVTDADILSATKSILTPIYSHFIRTVNQDAYATLKHFSEKYTPSNMYILTGRPKGSLLQTTMDAINASGISELITGGISMKRAGFRSRDWKASVLAHLAQRYPDTKIHHVDNDAIMSIMVGEALMKNKINNVTMHLRAGIETMDIIKKHAWKTPLPANVIIFDRFSDIKIKS